VQSRNPDEQEKQQELERWARQAAIPAALETEDVTADESVSDRRARF